MYDKRHQPHHFPRTIVDVVAPSVVALGAAEEGFVIAASAKEDPQGLLRVAMTREAARNLARAILDKTDPRPADDETPATNSPASLYDDVEVHDAFAALTERVAILEKIAGVRWAKAATGKTDATAVCCRDWACGPGFFDYLSERDIEDINRAEATYRDMAANARQSAQPAIEKTIYSDGGTIDAVVTFPTDDAFVRVGLSTAWNPHEKTGATDARIIAEARQVLAEVSTAWPGSGV